MLDKIISLLYNNKLLILNNSSVYFSTCLKASRQANWFPPYPFALRCPERQVEK